MGNCKCLIFSKWILQNQKLVAVLKIEWVEKKVRAPNIQATNVLRCSNEPESKADLRSVKISELAQKLTEIATFSCQFGLNLWKFEKKIGYLCQIDRSFDRRGGKNRFQREIGANGSPILPTFCQYNKVKPWQFEKLMNFKEKIDFDTYRSLSNCSKKEEMKI